MLASAREPAAAGALDVSTNMVHGDDQPAPDSSPEAKVGPKYALCYVYRCRRHQETRSQTV